MNRNTLESSPCPIRRTVYTPKASQNQKMRRGRRGIFSLAAKEQRTKINILKKEKKKKVKKQMTISNQAISKDFSHETFYYQTNMQQQNRQPNQMMKLSGTKSEDWLLPEKKKHLRWVRPLRFSLSLSSLFRSKSSRPLSSRPLSGKFCDALDVLKCLPGAANKWWDKWTAKVQAGYTYIYNN